ncbi:hypothetical protein [Nocardia sp. NPDC052112]|uniref:hypothetical protein n=1 Tax=Nocardia sp. NPDC052112 TaxID=3155646 RepID=UPI0034231355
MLDQPDTELDIVTTIGRRSVSRSEVLAWETRRARKVLSMLGIDAAAGELATARVGIVERKLALGHERIESLLHRQLRASAIATRALAGLSAGHRTHSTIDLDINTGSVQAFVRWWNDYVVTSDEPPLLEVCPDHWIIRPGPNGWQEVVETTGGSPIASECSSTTTTPDPSDQHPIRRTRTKSSQSDDYETARPSADSATECVTLLPDSA